MKKAKQIEIAKAVEMSCLLEASSEKPGNVTPTRQFEDSSYSDFVHASVILGQVFRDSSYKNVGGLILDGVKQCMELCGTNTHLGIILLLSPLSCAYYKHGALDVDKVRSILTALTKQDAEKTFKAIEIANPGGLGKDKLYDVHDKPKVTLLRAMKQAADRDWLAHEYSSNFDITFSVSLPELTANLESGLTVREAIVQTFLKILYLYPDSHIARKTSPEIALKISEKAGKALTKGGLLKPAGRRAVYDFDHYLRTDGNKLNPGTTADLITAALFVYFLRNGYKALDETGR